MILCSLISGMGMRHMVRNVEVMFLCLKACFLVIHFKMDEGLLKIKDNRQTRKIQFYWNE